MLCRSNENLCNNCARLQKNKWEAVFAESKYSGATLKSFKLNYFQLCHTTCVNRAYHLVGRCFERRFWVALCGLHFMPQAEMLGRIEIETTLAPTAHGPRSTAQWHHWKTGLPQVLCLNRRPNPDIALPASP